MLLCSLTHQAVSWSGKDVPGAADFPAPGPQAARARGADLCYLSLQARRTRSITGETDGDTLPAGERLAFDPGRSCHSHASRALRPSDGQTAIGCASPSILPTRSSSALRPRSCRRTWSIGGNEPTGARCATVAPLGDSNGSRLPVAGKPPRRSKKPRKQRVEEHRWNATGLHPISSGGCSVDARRSGAKSRHL